MKYSREMSEFWMSIEAEAGGKRFFNGRIFKFIYKPEQRRNIGTLSPSPEYWREPSTRNCNYGDFTNESCSLEMCNKDSEIEDSEIKTF